MDPSWAVGEDDGGNGYATDGTLQCAIGPDLHFSGKTAGGGLLRPTVQNNRMAIGVLGMSDAIGATKNNTNANPLRALAYSNTTDGQTANYVQPTASTISDGSYVIWQKEQYVTVRNPDAADYSNDEKIKGDPNGDIAQLRDNVINSVNANFPNPASFNDPADQLLANSFILPQMMLVDKTTDGGATFDVSNNVANPSNPLTNAQWRTEMLAEPTVTTNFATLPGRQVTAGSNSMYGVVSGVTSLSFTGGTGLNVPITAEDSSGMPTSAASAPKGNYLFGNFNQNGVRDFSAVMAAVTAEMSLDSGPNAAANIDVGNATVPNNTVFSGISPALDSMNGGTGPTKGDLIVLGDFNGDGKFDGEDLYLMARGAAVSDAASTSQANFNGGTLNATASTFGTAILGAQLRKNAALDYLNTTIPQGASSSPQASANLTNDPTGINAFNKFDVNRDGLINLTDAQIVDHFVGSNYTNINDQLNATIATDGTINPSKPQRSISLVDVELNDNGMITSIAAGPGSDGTGSSDFKLIRQALGSQLLDGDTNFDGTVNTLDFNTLAADFNKSGQKWSTGDFNFDGTVNAQDLTRRRSIMD